MAHTFIRDGFDPRSLIPVLTKPEEQPIDNESKENIYLSSRLVEKQRLEDAKILEQYDKKCQETKEYRALQEAKTRIDKKYEKQAESLQKQLNKSKNGKPIIEKYINEYNYYKKVVDAFDKVPYHEINRNIAVFNKEERRKDLSSEAGVLMSNQLSIYKKLQKIEQAKQSELQPYEHDFEVAANRRRRGPVREALRRTELMNINTRLMELDRECAKIDAYEASFEESVQEVNKKTAKELRDSYLKLVTNDYDAVLAKVERNELIDRWEKMEQEVWNAPDNLNSKNKADLDKTSTFCDNLAERREWRRQLAEQGCKLDEVNKFLKTVDNSVSAMSEKIQSGSLPISVLEARSYDPSSYDVKIEKVAPGTKVHNKLENSDYVTDDERCFVVTGTAGEQWPVNGDKLKSKYGLNPESIKDGESTTAHVNGGSDGIWAVPVTGNHKIETSWGDVLETNAAGVEHGDGDYIVSNSPDFSDTWVVNGAVFGNTYEASEDNTFVSKAFDKVVAQSQSGDADDFVNDIVGSSANSKYETFKDKDGNKCRRDKSTGETTVWVEGYDRVRCGKVEHVKSYWKVLHK